MKILNDKGFKYSVSRVEESTKLKFDSVTRGDHIIDVNFGFINLGTAATIIKENPSAEDRSQAIEKFKELVKGIENKFLFEQELKSYLDTDKTKAGLIKQIRGVGSHSGPSHFAVSTKALNISLDAIHKLLIEASNQPGQDPYTPKGGF